MTHAYDDIIGMPHHRSQTRKPMSVMDRAAQFAPFAALTGYGDEVEEAGRQTEREIILEESDLAQLDRSLMELEKRLSSAAMSGSADRTGSKKNVREGVAAEITCFEPDARKDGGRYINQQVKVCRVEQAERALVLDSGKRIPLARIVSMKLI